MLKVLIVDDSILARKLLRSLLDKMNYEIVGEAESGEKALIKYKSSMPELVLMDVVMPGIGGIEASKKILAQYPDAKIIITSAHMQNNLKAELIKNRLNYLIVKPINESNLSDTIQRVFSNAGSNIQVDQDGETKLRAEVRNYLKKIAKNIQGTTQENTTQENTTQENTAQEAIEFSAGMAVSVGHYFSQEPLKATVNGRISNKLSLGFESKFENNNFCIEDPVTICFYSKDSCKICLASVCETIPEEKCIRVLLERTDLLDDDAIVENFPSSMQIDFKSEFGTKKQAAIIKNIGPYNSKIVTRTELNPGEKLSFNINLEDKVISISAEVTSKKQGMYTFEYDLKTTYIDLGSKRFLKLFVNRLKDNHKDAICKL